MSSLLTARSRIRSVTTVRAVGLGAALLVGLAACGTSNAADTAGPAAGEPTVEVSDAWVRR